MWNNHRYRIGLLLLAVLLCFNDFAHSSTAPRGERFWPTRNSKDVTTPTSPSTATTTEPVDAAESIAKGKQDAFPENQDTTESSKTQRRRVPDWMTRRSNNATKVDDEDKEKDRKDDAAETRRDSTEIVKKETTKSIFPGKPDWLRRVVPRDKEETTRDTSNDGAMQEVTREDGAPQPLSRKKQPRMERKESRAGDVSRGWPSWFPVPDTERTDETQKGTEKETESRMRRTVAQENEKKLDSSSQGVSKHAQTNLDKQSRTEGSRERVADRGWPAWYPLPNKERTQKDAEKEAPSGAKRTIQQEDQIGSDASRQGISDQVLTNSDVLRRKEVSRQGVVDRGWPAWFPRISGDNKDTEEDQSRVSLKPPNVQEGETGSNEAPPEVSNRGIRPVFKRIHDFRDRLPQNGRAKGEDKTLIEHEEGNQEKDETKSLAEMGSSQIESSASSVFQDEEESVREEPRRVARKELSHHARLAALQQSASNATAFLRRLPWSSGRTETTVDTTAKRHQAVVNKTSDDVTASLSLNPMPAVRFVKKLPWTPERCNEPNRSECVEEATILSGSEIRGPSQTALNPIKFLRGLPWTPRVPDRDATGPNPEVEEKGKEISPRIEAGNRIPTASASFEERPQVQSRTTFLPGQQVPQGSHATNDESGGKAKQQNEDEDDTISMNAVKNLELVPRGAPFAEPQNAARDEAEAIKNEILDAIGNYVERHEESNDSEKEDSPRHRPPLLKSAKEDEPMRSKMITDSIRQCVEQLKRSKDVENDAQRLRAERSTREDKGTDNEAVDSMDKSEERHPEQRQLSESSAYQNVAQSKTTLTPVKPEDESHLSPEPATIDEVPPSNRTSAPARLDGVPPPSSLEPPKLDHQQSYQQQPHQPTMIVMGGPHDGRPMPAGAGRPPPPSSTFIFAEALGSLVGAAARIWLISFFTKWWSEEDILRPVQHFVWERLNDRFIKDDTALQNVLQLPPANVSQRKWHRYLRRQHRTEGKVDKKSVLQPNAFHRTVVVLEISGVLNLPHLEQAVTFILMQHRQQAFGSMGGLAKELEVVLLVESPGGGVQDFGLAAAQVGRLTNEVGVTTTVCVDKVAASGGYMIASQSNNLFAAPFAIVGSIGVIGRGINIHDALEKYGVKGIVLKAGNAKVPLTTYGPVTSNDINTAQRTLDSTHKAFQELVVRGRPQLEASVADVCNGNTYLGEAAESLSLVDRVITSEEYLLERIQDGDRVLKLHRAHQNVGRRKLFNPLDFLQEKSASLRAAGSKWMASDLESTISQVVAATGVMGAIKVLAKQSARFGGDT